IAGNAILALAGDVAGEHAPGLWARHLGALRPGANPVEQSYPDPLPRRGLHLTIVDKPERTQSQILIGQAAPSWNHPDFYPLHVALTAFGGTFTSKLVEEVRVKRGLSYGASARLWRGRGKRALVMHVFPSLEQTAETLVLVLGLYRQLAETGLGAAD